MYDYCMTYVVIKLATVDVSAINGIIQKCKENIWEVQVYLPQTSFLNITHISVFILQLNSTYPN
jgi:hypothetical protein